MRWALAYGWMASTCVAVAMVACPIGGCLASNPQWDGDGRGTAGMTTETTDTTTATSASTAPSTTTATTTATTTTATVATATTTTGTPGSTGGPSGSDAIVEYFFDEGEGGLAVDRSGVDPSINIAVPGSFAWTASGLMSDGGHAVATGSSDRLAQAVIASAQLSIELWITPSGIAGAPTDVPDRIVALSFDNFRANFVLGQRTVVGDGWLARLRTAESDDFGEDLEWNGSVDPVLTHLVLASGSGTTSLYIDGTVAVFQSSEGPANWDEAGMMLSLGNEFASDRPWIGEYHYLAIFDRELDASEVVSRFEAGVPSR